MEDIKLPYDLATSGLSLHEIGGIFVLFASTHMTSEEKAKWDKDKLFSITMKSLVKNEIININQKGGDVYVEIDLEKIQ